MSNKSSKVREVKINIPDLGGDPDEIIYGPVMFGPPDQITYMSMDRKSFVHAMDNVLKSRDLCNQIDDYAHLCISMLMNDVTSSPDPFSHFRQIIDCFEPSMRETATYLAFIWGSELMYMVARRCPRTRELEKSGAVAFVERTGARGLST